MVILTKKTTTFFFKKKNGYYFRIFFILYFVFEKNKNDHVRENLGQSYVSIFLIIIICFYFLAVLANDFKPRDTVGHRWMTNTSTLQRRRIIKFMDGYPMTHLLDSGS